MINRRLPGQIALLWAGVVIGCSFVATPAKFLVPSLSLPTALEIGRVTFRSLVAAELALVVLGIVVLIRLRQRCRLFWYAVAVLAVQWIVVMPLLNARTDAVVSGVPATGPPWHVAYIVLEVAKLVILIILAFSNKETNIGSNQTNI